MTDKARPTTCPACGSPRVASILYGLPHFTPELEKDLDDGRIVLGGCTIFGEDPQWRCQACNHTWGSIEVLPPDLDAPA